MNAADCSTADRGLPPRSPVGSGSARATGKTPSGTGRTATAIGGTATEAIAALRTGTVGTATGRTERTERTASGGTAPIMTGKTASGGTAIGGTASAAAQPATLSEGTASASASAIARARATSLGSARASAPVSARARGNASATATARRTGRGRGAGRKRRRRRSGIARGRGRRRRRRSRARRSAASVAASAAAAAVPAPATGATRGARNAGSKRDRQTRRLLDSAFCGSGGCPLSAARREERRHWVRLAAPHALSLCSWPGVLPHHAAAAAGARCSSVQTLGASANVYCRVRRTTVLVCSAGISVQRRVAQ